MAKATKKTAEKKAPKKNKKYLEEPLEVTRKRIRIDN